MLLFLPGLLLVVLSLLFIFFLLICASISSFISSHTFHSCFVLACVSFISFFFCDFLFLLPPASSHSSLSFFSPLDFPILYFHFSFLVPLCLVPFSFQLLSFFLSSLRFLFLVFRLHLYVHFLPPSLFHLSLPFFTFYPFSFLFFYSFCVSYIHLFFFILVLSFFTLFRFFFLFFTSFARLHCQLSFYAISVLRFSSLLFFPFSSSHSFF